MPVVCFLATVAYFPWFVGPSNSAKFILLCVAIPIFAYRARVKITPPMVIGGTFLAWTALTLTWGWSLDGIDRLWWWMLGAGAFVIGAGIRCLDKCLIGFAVGVAVNALISVAQTFGWDALVTGYFGLDQIFVTAPRAGLMVNGNYLAEAGLMAFAAMLAMRKWWLAPPLPGCRGPACFQGRLRGAGHHRRPGRLPPFRVLLKAGPGGPGSSHRRL